MRFSAAETASRFLPGRIAARLRPVTERLDAVLTDSGPQASAQRSSLVAFSVRVASAAIALLSQVILARWMGEFEYGIFVLVWLTMIIIGDLACFGLHTTIIRFVPEYMQRQMFGLVRGIIGTGRVFAFAAATFIALLGAGLLLLLKDHVTSYYLVPFILGFICLPMITLGNMLDGIARSRTWVMMALTPSYIVRPLLVLLFMIIAHEAGLPSSATIALAVSIAATWLTTVGQFLTVDRSLEKDIPAATRDQRLGEWMKVALPIFLVEGFFFLLINVDVLMVGHALDPEHVAIYFAATKIMALAHFVYFAVKASVAQRYSDLLHSGDRAEFASFAEASVRWTFWPTLFLGAVILLAGYPLLRLFGPAFTAGYPLLFILIIGVIARASVGPAESLLNMSGKQNICALLYAVTLAVNVILNLVLIPRFGLTGAAISTAIAMLMEAALLSAAVSRTLHITMFILIPRDRTKTSEGTL
ncbi:MULTISPECIES: lipopolysaccharide biosynthesis protein [Brucella/Ochrobactrum group]|uniref:lipopolysaccharide biosynthesis protein n=1 Tax=Brucella/Ochrobactrum group TaxID=2826938 RepID=UPI00142DAADE|nr:MULTISPECIES: lipopolysaccharide biosynthesis protein [Brucella]MCQ9144000.1 lipopolysaccharide biosynthesis protein [Ochrobactrum sp. BTU2]MCR8490005.1 lipopolysaccharide biosynthesis protein [Brucella anthropi]UGQ20894.1 lipopolysaccharide biosynthesis protein [Brucella anthropi]